MCVGIAGLGKMGAIFAGRLLDAGHEVAVWNRNLEKAKPFEGRGAKLATSPRQLSQKSDIVLTVVTDDAAVNEVFQGKEGLLAGDAKGKLFVDMSTVMPGTHVEIQKAVEEADARFIECPVGGSVKVAGEGGLLGFAGGDAADIDRARDVLNSLCRRVERAGPVGAGAALKLAINLPLLVYWQALGEAVALCEGFGLDPAFMVEMFSESSGGPNTLKVRGPAIVKALGGEDVPVGAPVDTMRKDLGLMLAVATANNVESPLVERVHASYGRAQEAGLGNLDCTAFPAYWAKQGNKRR